MQRRSFLKRSAAIALRGQLLRGAGVHAVDATNDLDRFGGWKAKCFRATGFFCVEKDDRWWLVTPEGNAFLSWGINHRYPDLWKQGYNREKRFRASARIGLRAVPH